MYSKTTVFISACLGMLLFGVSLITLGSIATDLQAKFSLDPIATGTLFSILPFGILAGSLVFGPVCDRYGYKLLLICACVGMFAGFQGIAFAASLALLKISVLVFGIGAGIVNGATNALVADISEEHRGANLSLLGVFFGLGALGMPLVLGLLSGRVEPFKVVASIGWLTLAVALLYALIQLPPAKPRTGETSAKWSSLFSLLLVLIAFFLFFQSALEAIVNNWATTYLINHGIAKEDALFALSLHIAGMVVARLLTGSVLRRVSQVGIMWSCLVSLAAGIFLMQIGSSFPVTAAGLILSGAGLSGGFPIMLGFVGERFASLSGTAFSFVFVVALVGNMLINYAMGVIVHQYGIEHLTTVSYIQIGAMSALFLFIVQKLRPTIA